MSVMGWRYFKYVQGNHDKFWNISLQDRACIVRFGRTGTTGQERVKTFISDLKARTAFDQKIGEKLGKGYVETTAVLRKAVLRKAGKPKPANPRRKTKEKLESDALREPKRAISFD